MKKIIISISGSDNSGKSTQLKLLHSKYPDVFSKPLHITHFPAYPKNVNPLALSKWWWTRENARDMTRVMLKSMKERNDFALNYSETPFILYDRDDYSYENKILSALLVMHYSFEEAKAMIEDVKNEINFTNNNIEDLRLFIKVPNERSSVKVEENANSYNPALYARHLITTKVLDKHTVKTHDYTILNFIDGDIERVNDDIKKVICEKFNVELEETKYEHTK